ncbi:MAG: 30S ribosomal protein S20 [Candidatus Tectomicrobia bacterium]|nr:30S ribosomal protein S20 [Candidatus Tectomicrobia bacterium]
MANRHPSAVKRNRQNKTRNERNTMLRSALRTTIRRVTSAVSRNDAAAAQAELPVAVRALGKASTKGIIHKNQAARRISRLTRKVAALAAQPS